MLGSSVLVCILENVKERIFKELDEMQLSALGIRTIVHFKEWRKIDYTKLGVLTSLLLLTLVRKRVTNFRLM